MAEASNLWFRRVDRAFQELHETLDEHRRVLIAQAAARSELRLAIVKAQIANVQDAMPPPEEEAEAESRAA
jgi:hypothetical protein